MWCPLGFVHFHKIEEVIEVAASRIIPWEKGRELIYLDEEEEEFDYEQSNEFRRFVVSGKLLELFLQEYRYNACAACISGQIVRLSGHVVRPVIFNHWMRYEKRFSRRVELLYIDISTGKIDTYGVEKRFLDWNGDDGYGDAGKAWQDNAVSDLSDLNGWVVCYPESEIMATPEHLIELWETRVAPSEENASRVGRPRRRELAAQAYTRIFPDGHGNMSWKEVLRKLEDADVFVSLTTLQRALGQKD